MNRFPISLYRGLITPQLMKLLEDFCKNAPKSSPHKALPCEVDDDGIIDTYSSMSQAILILDPFQSAGAEQDLEDDQVFDETFNG